MRAFLGAASVEVQVRFADDLLHVTEMTVAQTEKCYRVGLATTAQLPLPLSPFVLLRVVDDRLELCVPDCMQTEGPLDGGETVFVKWRDVEIAVVPSLPSRAHPWARRRSWPVELLSSSAATVAGLLGLFPAALLLLSLSGGSEEEHDLPPSRIVYLWHEPLNVDASPEAEKPAPPAKATARARKKPPATNAAPATPPPQPAQANAAAPSGARAEASSTLHDRESGDAAASAQDHDAGFAGSASAANTQAERSAASARETAAASARETATAAARETATASARETATAAARQAAARAGILRMLDGRVQIAASAHALALSGDGSIWDGGGSPPDSTSDTAAAGGSQSGAPSGGGSSGAPSGGSSGAPSGGSSGAPSGGSNSGASGGGSSGAPSGGGSSGAPSGGGSSGSLQGTDIGEAYGVGGLGLVGSGAGGSGDGTIGLGNIGTIGRGGGGGTGSGYGSALGGLGGRRAHAPDVVPGTAEVRGGIDKEMIRRVIRRHLNEVRFCYESALQSAPELAGRVRVAFVIRPDGSVAASEAQESSFADSAIGSCVADAFRRWQFHSVPNGGVYLVHYPFEFVPEGS